MSRLSSRSRDQLDAAGQAVWDTIAGSRGDRVVDEDGGLRGPFNAYVRVPRLGALLTRLGSTLRAESPIERRLIELAIITVGARWKAEYEWWAHSAMAREHGVSESVIAAIGRGQTPDFDRDDERIVHAMARELAEAGTVSPETYAAAHDLLGDESLIELVTLCGYYTLVSFTLNAFDVPLPPGAEQMWGDGQRPT